MTFCEKYSDLIHDLLEDEPLDEHCTAQAESHIFACRRCREQYETLRRAEEIYGQYLFEAEQPADSWANFEARLISENEKANGEELIAASWFRRRQRIFSFGFSPATAALAALLLVCGIGFALWQAVSVEKRGEYIAKTENSPNRAQSNKIGEKPTMDLQAQIVVNDDAQKNKDLLAENKLSKTKSNSLLGKKSPVATAKNNQKPASSSAARKSASELRLNKENRLSDLQAQNLETEIAGEMEKVELLLRSFRNAQSNETSEGFDVEYEKRQARKLLDKIARLRRDAENRGISYAEELLSQVEPYLLDIANLETDAAPDKVLDIKERVISQNIIATLQVYNRDAAQ